MPTPKQRSAPHAGLLELKSNVQFSMVVEPLEGMLAGKESAIIVGIEVNMQHFLDELR